jgi:hypothetical protein
MPQTSLGRDTQQRSPAASESRCHRASIDSFHLASPVAQIDEQSINACVRPRI